jgi:hypothetical protein
VRRTISPALFAVVVICFFLPFFTVACSAGAGLAGLGEELGGDLNIPASQQVDVTVSGWDLVIGNTEEQAEVGEAAGEAPVPEPQGEDDRTVQIFAILALAAAALGAGLSLLRLPLGPALAIAFSVLGILFLFLLRNRITGDVPAQVQAFLDVETEYGFWLALVFFLLAGGWGLYRLAWESPLPTGAAGFGRPAQAHPGPAPPP